jgi:hypothetical protein
MEPMSVFLGILMRWIHIASVTVLLGAVIYARFVVYPALKDDSIHARIAQHFSPWILMSLAGIVGSGLYNFLTKSSFPAGYHMWFGIKMLLALHVVAVAFLLARATGDAAKRARWMRGVAASGLAIIAISAYLRWISTHA